MNEVTLYLICVHLFVFTDPWYNISAAGHVANGVLFVLLVLCNIIYNIYVIIRYAYERYKLYWTRRTNLIEHRKTRASLKQTNATALARHREL